MGPDARSGRHCHREETVGGQVIEPRLSPPLSMLAAETEAAGFTTEIAPGTTCAGSDGTNELTAVSPASSPIVRIVRGSPEILSACASAEAFGPAVTHHPGAMPGSVDNLSATLAPTPCGHAPLGPIPCGPRREGCPHSFEA